MPGLGALSLKGAIWPSRAPSSATVLSSRTAANCYLRLEIDAVLFANIRLLQPLATGPL
jgi:hypothetical protein